MDNRKFHRAVLDALFCGAALLGALAAASPTYARSHGHGHSHGHGGHRGYHSRSHAHEMNCATHPATRWTFFGPRAGWS